MPKDERDTALDYAPPEPARRSPWPSATMGFTIIGVFFVAFLLADGAEVFTCVMFLCGVFSALRTLQTTRSTVDRVLALAFLAVDIFALGALAPSVIHWFHTRIW